MNIKLTERDLCDPKPRVWTVNCRELTDDTIMEVVLCDLCQATGRVKIIERKPNLREACHWCGRYSADLRPILKAPCDCHPPIMEAHYGHRNDRGNAVPTILLTCRHGCGKYLYVDYDWLKLGRPQWRHLQEGY